MSESPNTSTQRTGWRRHLTAGRVALGAALAFLLLLCGGGGYVYSARQDVVSDLNNRSSELNGLYRDTHNYLSDCIVKTEQKVQVATAFSDELDDILSNAMRGRYDNKSGEVDNQMLFRAMQEAYPDLSSLERIFDAVMQEIGNCRTNVRDKQWALSDKVAAFDRAMSGTWKARTFGWGYPNNKLMARTGPGSEHVKYGREAYDAMTFVMSDEDATKARETGVIPKSDLFGGSTPAPASSGAGTPNPTGSPR